MMVNKLFQYQDLKYRDFSSKLLPNIKKENIIGVKIPQIRLIAKKYKNTHESEEFVNNLPHKYLEENILHGCLISFEKDINKLLDDLNIFLSYVDNWEVCDTIRPKIFKKNIDILYKKILLWIKSEETYKVRFSIVMLLTYFLDENFNPKINELVLNIKSNEYYINMAISWYFSFALVKQYDSTIYIFENNLLEKKLHNKSIQKAIESYRICDEKKKYLRNLKIK